MVDRPADSDADSAGRNVREVHRIARPATGSGVRRPLRRRLVVVTPSLAEAVRFTGGWLFDRATAGWDVTVLRADHADARPLRILGARAACLEPVLASPVRGPRPQAIAVHTDLYDSDQRVRRMVLHTGDDESAEVIVWGGLWPVNPDVDAGVDAGAGPVRHRLSAAARAFKAQAMAAAAVSVVPDLPADSEEATELFRSLRLPHRVRSRQAV